MSSTARKEVSLDLSRGGTWRERFTNFANGMHAPLKGRTRFLLPPKLYNGVLSSTGDARVRCSIHPSILQHSLFLKESARTILSLLPHSLPISALNLRLKHVTRERRN